MRVCSERGGAGLSEHIHLHPSVFWSNVNLFSRIHICVLSAHACVSAECMNARLPFFPRLYTRVHCEYTGVWVFAARTPVCIARICSERIGVYLSHENRCAFAGLTSFFILCSLGRFGYT